MASKAAAGSRSSSSAPITAADQRCHAEPEDARALADEVGPPGHAPENEPGAKPTVLETLASTGGNAEGEQGRERDQSPRAHHRVDQTRPAAR